MQVYGELLLGLALVWALGGAAVSILGAHFRRPNLVDAGRYALYALTAVLWAMALVLSHAFLTHDFANKYVATYSDRGMPVAYLLSAFWGGEKGALLFWVTSLSTFSAISIHQNRRKDTRWIGLTNGFLLLIVAFFQMLMVFESNPFETFLTHGGPADGQGMNPLLQNPTMMIHPPSLLTGYITFSIPFAYGLGALISGKLDTEWIRVTRFWTIVSWTFLTVGLILGGAWAYQELGWGGYWMWDPVENAGLIPWFTSTAFLHSVMIQERRGMLKRWNAILVCLTFFLTIFGTFLTRSQLIASIHAFVASPLVDYFIALMAGIIIVSAAAIAYRWKELRSPHSIESFWSRESFFILNNVMLVGCAVIVTWGTLFPKFSELEGFRNGFNSLVGGFNSTLGHILGPMEPLHQSVDLGEPWFNKVMVPIGLMLLLLTAAGPIIAWRRTTAANFRKNFMRPLLWAVPPTILSGLAVASFEISNLADRGLSAEAARAAWMDGLGLQAVYILLSFYTCYFVVTSIYVEYSRAVTVRRKKLGGARLWHALVVTLRARRRFGGYIVHFGMVLCFLAFTGSAFQVELPEQVVHPGDVLEMGGYRLTLARLDDSFESDGQYVSARATVVVRDMGAPVDGDLLEKFGIALETHELMPAKLHTKPGHAKIHAHVSSDEQRQLLLGAGLVNELMRNYERLGDEADGLVRVYRFRHQGVLQLQPRAFMRHTRELRSRLSEMGPAGIEPEISQGSSVVRLKLEDEGSRERLEAMEAIAGALPRTHNIRAGDGRREIELIPAGVGRLLIPEIRSYAKHDTPTTEIAIESHALEDVYLAMRPAVGKPYINLLAVVAPLVSMLWLGAAIMVLGALIAVLPDQAVAFVRSSPKQKRRRPAGGMSAPATAGRASTAALFAVAIAGLLAAGGEMARAQQGKKSHGLERALSGLSCPDRADGSWLVHEERTLADCDTDEGRQTRDLLAGLAARLKPLDLGRATDRAHLFRAMVDEDPRTDRLLRVPMGEFNSLWQHTTCLCGCSHILFQCGLECGPGKDWKLWLRQMFAAGYTKDQALDAYIAFWNERRPVTAAPYSRESVTKDPGKAGSWAFPIAAAVLFSIALVAWLLRRGRRDEEESKDSEEEESRRPDALIDDLLDDVQSPLD